MNAKGLAYRTSGHLPPICEAMPESLSGEPRPPTPKPQSPLVRKSGQAVVHPIGWRPLI